MRKIWFLFSLIFLLLISIVIAEELPTVVEEKEEDLTHSVSKSAVCSLKYISNDEEADIHNINEFFNLGLTEEIMQVYAKIIKEEVYPSFIGGFCDEKSYLLFLFNKLNLTIEDEQIERLITHVKDLEDIELVNDNLEEPNIDKLEGNITQVMKSMTSMDTLVMDTADNLIGNTFIIVIFVNDPSHTWTDSDRTNALNKISETKNWMEQNDPSSANVVVSYGYYNTQISTDPNDCQDNYYCQCRDWMNEAVGNLGFTDSNSNGYKIDEINNFIKNYYGVDNVFPIFMIKNAGWFGADSSYSCDGGYIPRIALFYYELCFIFCNAHESDAYIHESLHAFSADDEYPGPWTCDNVDDCNREVRWGYTNGNCNYCPGTQNSIMKCCGSGTSYWASPYTKGQIGWGDHDSDNTLDPKDSCMYNSGYVCNGCPAPSCSTCYEPYCPLPLGEPYCGPSNSASQCSSDYYEYSCPWGNSLGSDTGIKLHDFHCNGAGFCLDYPQNWQIDEDCLSNQYCYWDGSGNQDQDYFCYTIDTTPPNITIITPINNSWYNLNSVFINIYAGETAKWIKESKEGSNNITMCNNCSAYAYNWTGLSEGTHSITISASDYYNNIGVKTHTFYVDTIYPSVISYNIPDGSLVNKEQLVNLSVEYTEINLDKIQLFWNKTWPYICSNINVCPPVTLTSCTSGTRKTCSYNLNVSSYPSGSTIRYYFGVFDKTGRSAYLFNPDGSSFSFKLCVPSPELCNGIDDNCDGAVDGGFTDTDGDGLADCVDPDDDNDGILDGEDNIIGDSSNVNTDIENLLFSVDGEEDKDDYDGVGNVTFTDNAETVVEFEYNFSDETILNLNEIHITINNTPSKGSMIVRGIDLTSQNKTKTIYIDHINASANSVCIMDAEVLTINEISSDCNASGEVSLPCDGTNGPYTCTLEGSRYKIEGLKHSAVIEYTPDAGCTVPTDGMVITENTTLCNGTYNLSNGIRIEANNIVLDCNDTTLWGAYSYPSYGILMNQTTNNTIRGCEIGWFFRSISLVDSPNSYIFNNDVSGKPYGIYLENSSNGHIFNNEVYGRTAGIYLSSSPNSTINNNNGTFNYEYGILVYSSPYINITANVIKDGVYFGMMVESDSCMISNNYVHDNNNGGISVYGNNCTIFNNSVSGGIYGIFIANSLNNIMFNNFSGRYTGIDLGFNANNNLIVYNNVAGTRDLFSNGAYDVAVPNNYWSTTNCSEINEKIIDYYDDPSYGIVDYQPFLDEPYPNGGPMNCTQCIDNDWDGFNQSQDSCGVPDCNDTNPSIHPNATELCNLVDDDCDGTPDEYNICDGICSFDNCLCSDWGEANCNAAYYAGIVGYTQYRQCGWWSNYGVDETCNGKDDDCDNGIDEGEVCCGNGIINAGEQCDGGDCCNSNCTFKSTQTICRVATGVCDISEKCTGSSTACPQDAKSIAQCRASVDACDVAENCDGINNDCPADAKASLSTPCDDGLWCSEIDYCNGNGNCVQLTARDCSGNNIAGIATCNNNPDNNQFTWDSRVAFTSVCDEVNDKCTTGDGTITHNCDKAQCGAECDSNINCPNTECDNLDGCYDGTYRDYHDKENDCTTECECEENTCTDYDENTTDNDGDDYDIECDNDCNDDNTNVNPGATEVCNGMDDNCNNLVDEGYLDSDGDGIADCIDPDDDNDGISDTSDNIIGNSSYVENNFDNLTFAVNAIEDALSFNGTANVTFKDKNKIIVEFDFNFSKEKLDLSNITINKQVPNATQGSIIIKGITLPENKTKTVYVDHINPSANRVCIKDIEIVSITEISENCTGSDEYITNCPGTNNGYECIVENNRYKVTGLKHSGIKEFIVKQTININLKQGWNLISIPLNLTNNTLPAPLKSIEGNYSYGFAYIDGKWHSYYAGEPSTNKTLDPTMGFWIYTINDDILAIEGYELDNVELDLNEGWNLIGYPSLDIKNVSAVFDNVSVVYAYNGSWSSYIPNRPFNSLQKLKPGFGYWVKK